MSINRPRKTNNKGKGKLRLSLKIEGILGQTDITIIGPEETLLGSQDLLLPRWLAQCSRNQCIKS